MNITELTLCALKRLTCYMQDKDKKYRTAYNVRPTKNIYRTFKYRVYFDIVKTSCGKKRVQLLPLFPFANAN